MEALHRIRRAALPASVAVYASTAVAPLITRFPRVPTDPALVLGVGVGIAAVALGGTAAADDLAGGIASLPTAAAFAGAALPGVGWLGLALAATASGPAVSWVAAAGVTSCLSGLAALWLAAIEASGRRIDDVTVHVRFGGDGPDRIALAGAAVAALGFLGIATAGLLDLWDDGGATALLTTIATLATAGSTLLSAAGDDEEDGSGTDGDDLSAAVTDAGVRIGDRLHDWDGLEGYRVTDDRIEIRRDAWVGRTLSFDRDDLDDEAAVVDALGRYLPRVDDEGRTEMAAARGHGRSLRDDDATQTHEHRRADRRGHKRERERSE